MRTLKLLSWNVNGLRACAQKGFLDFFRAADADVFALQETKLQAGQWGLPFEGYHEVWNYAEKKGYSGTAVFSKKKPLSERLGIGVEEHDHEGRVVTLEFPVFFFVCVYTPNSKQELERLAYRCRWEDAFRAYLKGLEAEGKPVVVCGDMNVAHQEIDLRNPATNHHSAGFTDEERGKFGELLAAGFLDTFRTLHPDARDAYSWWSYRARAREHNVGWRIDYFLASAALRPRLRAASIHPEVLGSDHCPVELDLDA